MRKRRLPSIATDPISNVKAVFDLKSLWNMYTVASAGVLTFVNGEALFEVVISLFQFARAYSRLKS